MPHICEFDPFAIAAEVGCVESQQPALAMGQHGRDDVGVVDLFAAQWHLAAQHDQPFRDLRPVLQDLECHFEFGRMP